MRPRSDPPVVAAPEREAVTAMFDRIAGRYDLLNRVLSARFDVRWRRAAVDCLALPAGAWLLDLCTGTGDVLLEWLGRHPRNRCLGLDGSREMLRQARSKITSSGLGPRAALVRGDAEDLPLAAGAFDGALVAFGFRNVRRRERALAEVRRVLRPGAPLAVLEFGIPPGLVGRVYGRYFSTVLPRVGRWVSGERAAYAYLPASVARFSDPAERTRLMEAAGFEEVSARPLTFGIAWLHRGVKPPAGA